MQHCEIGKNIHINIINIGHILGASVKGRGKCWFVVWSLVWVHYIQCSELMRIYRKKQKHTIWGMKIPIQIPINILVSLFQFFGFIRNGKIKWSTKYRAQITIYFISNQKLDSHDMFTLNSIHFNIIFLAWSVRVFCIHHTSIEIFHLKW